ncbi:MAG TPA: CHAT domain-containing protein [Thermoanaerobaculia bacterium]|nr:CHAT domain-containing protein [Thermoanaerobaculia bacterium]
MTLPLLVVALAAVIANPPIGLDQRLADAASLEQSGKSAEAMAAYQSLLRLATERNASRGAILDALSGLETNAGDYVSAVRHSNEAAAIYAGQRDERHRSAALNRAGVALLYAGDYRAAERSFGEAIAASSAVHDDAGRAEQITNLANVYLFLGRYADASASYDAVLGITAAHPDQSWTARRRRIVLVNRATLDQRLGRDEQALGIYRQVQASGRDLRPREQAQILMNLGVLYRHLGDPIKALKMYDDAMALFAREQQVDGELGVMKNRGIVLALDLGRLEEARQTFSDALDRATKASNRREMLQAQLYRAESELRSGALEAARADFQICVEAAHALGTNEEQWKALYGLGRTEMRLGRAAEAADHLHRAVKVIETIREAIRVPALKSDFFSDKREVYDALISVSLQSLTASELFELIERSHSRAWRERLGLTAPVTAASVQKALPENALLLDCWSSPLGSAVAAVTRDGIDIRAIVVNQEAIRNLVDTLAAGPSNDWRTAAAKIAPNLLPAALPKGVRHVIIVADGPLALVPFELLPLGRRLLIEEAAVSYSPTAAMLFRAGAEPTRIAPPWKLELRAFGDPHFGSAALDEAASVRMRLAASADEIRAIDKEIGGRSALHLGADDRKVYLYDTSRSAPILHIAAHASADVNAMEQSRILFSPRNAASSGADYLFLKEAYALPLKGVELAVLSACDTERGPLLRGEGVQSFSRAFLAAGARSTVTTLWRVPDRETVSLMTVFYYHLQHGASRAEALRLAKLRFLRSGSAVASPHYWASFVLTGEGSQPIPRAMTSTSVIAIALLVIVVALIAVWIVRRLAGSWRGRTDTDPPPRQEARLPFFLVVP